jgi:hypothetical protein
MYWKVPTIVPEPVRGEVAVGEAVTSSTPPAGSVTFARPKSSSLAPEGVSITLPGFRSRWMTFFRCALSSASAIWMA